MLAETFPPRKNSFVAKYQENHFVIHLQFWPTGRNRFNGSVFTF